MVLWLSEGGDFEALLDVVEGLAETLVQFLAGSQARQEVFWSSPDLPSSRSPIISLSAWLFIIYVKTASF